jgi:hypothetical protein
MKSEVFRAAPHLDGDGRAHRAAQDLLRLFGRHVDRALLTDLQEYVAGLHPGEFGRHTRQSADDDDPSAPGPDLGTDAPELTLGPHPEVGVLFGRQQDRVRIEGCERTIDGGVLELVQLLGWQL